MKYRVLTPITHDGKKYAVGDGIELPESEAAQLLEVNAITPYVRRFQRAIVVPESAFTSTPE